MIIQGAVDGLIARTQGAAKSLRILDFWQCSFTFIEYRSPCLPASHMSDESTPSK